MTNFNFQKTNIDGLLKIEVLSRNDNRGSFVKDYSDFVFKNNNIAYNLKEIFYTYSKKGVLRGLHFQEIEEQAKLVRCIKGLIWDVVVDLRYESDTFGKWLAFELSETNMIELLIPKGCAHGYLVLENSIVSYKCNNKFIDEYDSGIFWNDKNLKIEWPLEKVGGVENLIISQKDQKLKSFSEYSLSRNKK